MYIFLIILIIIASILLVLTVLAQNPKGGMAANFGASNQVMGVRQTSDFLEKFTWAMALSIVVLSLLASIAMSSHRKASASRGDKVLEQVITEREIALPNAAGALESAAGTTEGAVNAAEGIDVATPENITIVEPEVVYFEEGQGTAE